MSKRKRNRKPAALIRNRAITIGIVVVLVLIMLITTLAGTSF